MSDPIDTLMAAASRGSSEAHASLESIAANSGFSEETCKRAKDDLAILDGKVISDDEEKATDGDSFDKSASSKVKSYGLGIPGSKVMQHNTVNFVEKGINKSGFMDAWFLGILTLIVEPIMLFIAYCIFK